MSMCNLIIGNYATEEDVARQIYYLQDHGGVKAALYHLYWTDDLKVE